MLTVWTKVDRAISCPTTNSIADTHREVVAIDKGRCIGMTFTPRSISGQPYRRSSLRFPNLRE